MEDVRLLCGEKGLQPQISVIVPVYNVEKYLPRCLDSLLSQTFSEFDLILVDDGSPDKCGMICDQYAETDNRICVIHQKNAGLSAARNRGIEWSLSNSDSRWITFVDSDDWVHPQYLQILYGMVEKYKADLSICAYRKTDDNIAVQSMEIYSTEDDGCWSPEEFFSQYRVNATVAWGKLYKKNYFKNYRYPEGKLHEDEFITYQLLFGLPFIAYSSKPLYFYYINNNGIMHSVSMNKRKDAVEAYMQQLDFFEKNQFYKAKKSTIRAYAGELCSWIDESNSQMNLKNNRQCEKKLRRRLKGVLKQYKEQIPFKECRWAYSVVYPQRVKCIDFVERVLYKVKKILR